MYTMLIVDDLPIIVDGLTELFEAQNHLQLELLKAYSGEEALAVLGQTRVDIVVSDIQMPGLQGIELLREIRAQWPACKVIFLTGHNDFHYVQSAVKYGGFEYILKIESDEKIVGSVERAIERFEEERVQQQLIRRANERMRRAMPSLQKEYATGILQGHSISEDGLQRHFRELDLPLRADRPVLLLLGRIDAWTETTTPPDKALFLYAVQNIAEEVLAPLVRCYSFVYEQTKLVWFLQPEGEGEDSCERLWRQSQTYASCMLETIQQTCKELLKLPVSFAMGSEPVDWSGVSGRFHALKLRFAYGMGLSGEIILIDADERRAAEGDEAGGPRGDDILHHRVQLIGKCLENGRREEFCQQYLALSELWAEDQPSFERKIELFHALSAIFLAYINKSPALREHLVAVHDLTPLIRFSEPDLWISLRDYFLQTAICIFDWNAARGAELPAEIVQQAHRFIEAHVAKDISLNAIADHVGLNPSYFSRLYKQMTGIGLSDYINEYRNIKAKEMLAGGSPKVGDVAVALGYGSALAFIRFFKKQNGLTPQEYRTRRLQPQPARPGENEEFRDKRK
ncbi:response regulator [Cohnella sp. REN36]|uniref:response regulator n=1 Tax=Cohnella sp. REN36 TaxID=2887347 RepID=UPI001D13EDC8|nr:response regulator [Cohnella sp. REN36]MCC3375252.1 response regulator [Cohnella sp. REN36]